MERLIADANALFQSTRPSRGATGTIRAAITGRRSFQSTRPSRGATGVIFKLVDLVKFQSTRPSRGATHCACTTGATSGISIHAPLAGRDQERADGLEHRLDFNPRAPRGARPDIGPKIGIDGEISIHAPLAGRDFRATGGAVEIMVFQSTRPSRGATAPQWGQ